MRCRFDRKEFKHFAENLVLEMGQPFSVVSELLLLGALDVQPRDEQEFARLREIKVCCLPPCFTLGTNS